MTNKKKLAKVFYLDDERDLLEVFADAFSGPDLKIVTFSVVEEFLQAAKNDSPDLLLIDYRLPGTNGDEIGMQLDQSGVTTKKIIVTGDLNVVVRADFDGVIHKPFDPEKIEGLFKKIVPV